MNIKALCLIGAVCTSAPVSADDIFYNQSIKQNANNNNTELSIFANGKDLIANTRQYLDAVVKDAKK